MSDFMSIEKVFQQFSYVRQAFICGSFVGLKSKTSNFSVSDVLLVMQKKPTVNIYISHYNKQQLVPRERQLQNVKIWHYFQLTIFLQLSVCPFQPMFYLPESWTAGNKGEGSKGALKRAGRLLEEGPVQVGHLPTNSHARWGLRSPSPDKTPLSINISFDH